MPLESLELGFLSAFNADPDDLVTRMSYVDWLVDHDRPVAADCWRWLAAAGRTPWRADAMGADKYLVNWDQMRLSGLPLVWGWQREPNNPVPGDKAFYFHRADSPRHLPGVFGYRVDRLQDPESGRLDPLHSGPDKLLRGMGWVTAGGWLWWAADAASCFESLCRTWEAALRPEDRGRLMAAAGL